jgi:hypothetical protein
VPRHGHRRGIAERVRRVRKRVASSSALREGRSEVHARSAGSAIMVGGLRASGRMAFALGPVGGGRPDSAPRSARPRSASRVARRALAVGRSGGALSVRRAARLGDRPRVRPTTLAVGLALAVGPGRRPLPGHRTPPGHRPDLPDLPEQTRRCRPQRLGTAAHDLAAVGLGVRPATRAPRPPSARELREHATGAVDVPGHRSQDHARASRTGQQHPPAPANEATIAGWQESSPAS